MLSGVLASFFTSPYTKDILIFCIPIIAIIAFFWSDVLKNRDNNELKRSMVERGMSAQDIERVINAGAKKDEKNKGKEEKNG